MKQVVTIFQDNGSLGIRIEGAEVTVEDNILHVRLTGQTKKVRHGRQWHEEPQPDLTRSFPLCHVLEYQVEEMPAA